MMTTNWCDGICSDSVISPLVGVDLLYDWANEAVRLVGRLCDFLLTSLVPPKYSTCIRIFSFRNAQLRFFTYTFSI